MTLIYCEDCGKEVSVAAETCATCGLPVAAKRGGASGPAQARARRTSLEVAGGTLIAGGVTAIAAGPFIGAASALPAVAGLVTLLVGLGLLARSCTKK